MADSPTIVVVPGRHAAALADAAPVPGMLVTHGPGGAPPGAWPGTDGGRRPGGGRAVCCVLDPFGPAPLAEVWPRWARADDVPLVVAAGTGATRLRHGLVAAADAVIDAPAGTAPADLVRAIVDVAAKAAARCPHPVRTRRRLGVVTPWPPDAAGPAVSMHRLLAALPDGVTADVIAGSGAPPDVIPARLYPVAAEVEGWDATVCSIGDSPFHVEAWRALMAGGADVLLHDARISSLYETLLHLRVITAAAYRATVLRHEAHRLPAAMRAHLPAPVPAPDAARLGLTFLGDVLARAGRILVHSETAREIVVAERPDRAADVRRIVHGGPSPRDAGGPRDGARVVSLGHPRDPDLTLAAFARARQVLPSAHLDVVGDAGPASEQRRLRGLAARLGIADAVTFHGWVDDRAWDHHLDTAGAALQIRGLDRGESSATIANCMAAGLPVVTTAVGAAAELPEDAVVRLPAGAGAADIGDALASLLDDPARRRALASVARSYRATRQPADAARSLVAAVLGP